MKSLVFSTSIKDCRVDTFRAGGNGGQNQNKRNTGVRVVHPPSGAVGEAREQRSQLQNKKMAFRRMAESQRFKTWARAKALQLPTIDEAVEAQMAPENLRIEYTCPRETNLTD
jgi:hypothetical protein